MTDAGERAGGLETATLGGGCFWCLEAVFERVEGVASVTSGYAGGSVETPTYEQVSSGRTGHAEVVRVAFDPDVIPYRDVLEIFFAMHDPTRPNRQGADVGPQYRSIILPETAAQEATARAVMAELEEQGVFDAPVVTELEPLERFYPAEAYHQNYYRRHPDQPYCRVTIDPKVAKLRRRYASRLKEG